MRKVLVQVRACAGVDVRGWNRCEGEGEDEGAWG